MGWPEPDTVEGALACELSGRVDDGADLDNEEHGAGVSICRGRLEPWADLWPRLCHLD